MNNNEQYWKPIIERVSNLNKSDGSIKRFFQENPQISKAAYYMAKKRYGLAEGVGTNAVRVKRKYTKRAPTIASFVEFAPVGESSIEVLYEGAVIKVPGKDTRALQNVLETIAVLETVKKGAA